MEQAFTILATALVMFSGFFLYEQFRRLWSQIADLNRVIEGLKAENAKLEEASKRHLPYRTLEDLEHAKAAWIALNEELQIKQTLMTTWAHGSIGRVKIKGRAHNFVSAGAGSAPSQHSPLLQ